MLNEHMFKDITIVIRNPLQFIDFDNDSNETLYTYDIKYNNIILSYKHTYNTLPLICHYKFKVQFEKFYDIQINNLSYNSMIIP